MAILIQDSWTNTWRVYVNCLICGPMLVPTRKMYGHADRYLWLNATYSDTKIDGDIPFTYPYSHYSSVSQSVQDPLRPERICMDYKIIWLGTIQQDGYMRSEKHRKNPSTTVLPTVANAAGLSDVRPSNCNPSPQDRGCMASDKITKQNFSTRWCLGYSWN